MGAIRMGLPMISSRGPDAPRELHGHPSVPAAILEYWASLGRTITKAVAEAGRHRALVGIAYDGKASTMNRSRSAGSAPGAASIPAADANHPRMAENSGRRIVEMAWEDLKPSDILTAKSVDNAITAIHALSGSTNAIIHLTAVAGRAGIALKPERFDEIARTTPVLANVRPAGTKYLMEDFYYAGGLRALLAELGDKLNLDYLTVNGKTLGENIAGERSTTTRHPQALQHCRRPWSCSGGTSRPTGIIQQTAAAPPPAQAHRTAVVQRHTSRRANRRRVDRRRENSVLCENGGPLGGRA